MAGPISFSLPTRGLSEVIGIMEETVLRNIVSDSRIVTPNKSKVIFRGFNDVAEKSEKNISFLPKLSFSPESGGKVKPNTAMEAISRQGTMRLEK